MTRTTPSSEVSDPLQAAPLTCANKAGKPYKRFADIEKAICKALEKPPDEWPDLARMKGKDRLPSEALVCLIILSQQHPPEVFGSLVGELGIRIARIARQVIKGVDPETEFEIIENVEIEAINLILSDPPCRQGEYLQITFRQKIEQLTVNAVQRRKKDPKPLHIARLKSLEGDDEWTDPVEAIADEAPNPEEFIMMLQDEARRPALLAAAIAAVKDKRHLEAVILRHVRGWPITDKDPTVPTLARRYKVSPRQIQNWIRDALDAMRAAIGDLK